MLRALALADLGRDEAARRLADEALTWATTDDGRTMGAYVGAEVDWLGGRARASLRTAREAIALQPEFPLVAALAAVAAWAAVDLGLRFELPALRDGPLHLPGHAAEAAAVAALSREDAPAEAERRFDAAAEAVADGSVRDELRCRWGAGEAALRSGARARARRRLLEVEDRARAHGFVPLLNRIRATQRRAGAKVGAGPRDAAGGLTAREQEVLGLVGEGCASGEIALRLGVATSTVETHVRSAMAKLGARSRAQAAAIARRRGG
jgi:DNA-binding NarL/FixJ family response regulator